MEISLESRLILAAKAARPKSVEAEEESKEAETAASAQKPRTDSVSLTGKAVETLREQSERLKNLLEQAAETLEPLPFPWEASAEEEQNKSELDAMEEGLKTMRKCMEIARRIMRGDKVPPEDEKYLMENDPDGYKLALAMRTPKKRPKEWESVLKDEKKSVQSNESGGEAAPAEACEASGGASGGGTSDTGGSAE